MRSVTAELRSWSDPPALHRASVLRYLGYVPGSTRLTPAVAELIDAVLAEAPAYLDCRAAVVHRQVLFAERGMVLLEGMSAPWQSRSLARILAGATTATLYFMTVGPRFDEEVDRSFAAGEYARATVLEAVASYAVHALVRRVRRDLARERAANCVKPGLPFGPGYGDWDIAAQAEVVRLIGSLPPGAHLTGSGYLEPRKSLTGLLGWFTADAAIGPADAVTGPASERGGAVAGPADAVTGPASERGGAVAGPAGGPGDAHSEPGGAVAGPAGEPGDAHRGASGADAGPAGGPGDAHGEPGGAHREAGSGGRHGAHGGQSEHGCSACGLVDCRYRVGSGQKVYSTWSFRHQPHSPGVGLK